jgi:hypothetical protein
MNKRHIVSEGDINFWQREFPWCVIRKMVNNAASRDIIELW